MITGLVCVKGLQLVCVLSYGMSTTVAESTSTIM